MQKRIDQQALTLHLRACNGSQVNQKNALRKPANLQIRPAPESAIGFRQLDMKKC
jgi:hypothetical protein